MLTNTENRYGLMSRFIHGIMLLLIFAMIGIGMYMTELEKTDPLRRELFGKHFATGVVVLILAVIRVIWVKASPGPKLPVALEDWEKTLTTVVKYLMYLLMILVPIMGILTVNSAGYPVSFYGLFKLPMLMGKSKEIHEFLGESHAFLAYSLLALIGLHTAGSLKHRFIDKDKDVDVLKRMYGK